MSGSVVGMATLNTGYSDSDPAEAVPTLCFFCAECFCEGPGDARIPLLREVFEAFPNTPVNIDIKVNNDTLIKKVCFN